MKFILVMLFSFGAYAGPDCELFPGRACLQMPTGKTPRSLHLYIRGHHKGRSDFSPAERTIVARETLLNKSYGLVPSAEKTNTIVVATGSSAVHFSEADVSALERKYQVLIEDLTVSAHSGGYVGLEASLKGLRSRMRDFKQVLMLDSFYGVPGTLKEYHAAGVPCRGFMTTHNAARVKKSFTFCEVEGPDGLDHDRSVGPFLEAHL